MRSRRSAFALGAALLWGTSAVAPTAARAAEPPPQGTPSEQEAMPKVGGTLRRAPRRTGGVKTDASFGRVDGDLSIVVGAGVTIGPQAPRATGDLRLRYLDTAGIFGTYEDDALLGTTSQPRRAIAVGAELRPLFLARWLSGYEVGHSWADLTIDSFGFEIAAVFLQPQNDAFDPRPGVQAGIGLELPLFAHATGLWLGLHGGIRWSDAALGGESISGPADRAGYLGITLAWHQFFVAHAVDMNDRAPQ